MTLKKKLVNWPTNIFTYFNTCAVHKETHRNIQDDIVFMSSLVTLCRNGNSQQYCIRQEDRTLCQFTFHRKNFRSLFKLSQPWSSSKWVMVIENWYEHGKLNKDYLHVVFHRSPLHSIQKNIHIHISALVRNMTFIFLTVCDKVTWSFQFMIMSTAFTEQT